MPERVEAVAFMRLIWSCTPGMFIHGSFGGYSDRLKGIVTAYLLAKRLGRDFAIEWIGATNISEFFNSKYFAESAFIHGSHSSFSTVDRLESARDISLMILDAERMGNVENVWMTANQYSREHWRLLSGQGTMESTFADVLDEIFQPAAGLFNHPAYVDLNDRMKGKRVLGLAIRQGDQKWDRPGCFRVPSDEEILNQLSESYHSIFIVSDSPTWKKAIRDKIEAKGFKTMMLDYQTANPDRSPVAETREAFPLYLIEHRLLGECEVIVTGDGGGGRTAAWWGRKPLVELIQ